MYSIIHAVKCADADDRSSRNYQRLFRVAVSLFSLQLAHMCSAVLELTPVRVLVDETNLANTAWERVCVILVILSFSE